MFRGEKEPPPLSRSKASLSHISKALVFVVVFTLYFRNARVVCTVLFNDNDGNDNNNQGMAKLLGLPASSPEGRELRMCASFGNSGPLPLLFVESLFGSNPGKLYTIGLA